MAGFLLFNWSYFASVSRSEVNVCSKDILAKLGFKVSLGLIKKEKSYDGLLYFNRSNCPSQLAGEQ